jgi:hypothetical protein
MSHQRQFFNKNQFFYYQWCAGDNLSSPAIIFLGFDASDRRADWQGTGYRPLAPTFH